MIAGTPQKKIWSILELLQWGTAYLQEKGFEEARLTTELLLAHSLRLKRIQLYTNFDRPLLESELAAFKTMFQRRLQHEPVQYIIGQTQFMGLEFQVDDRVLIPRPETEVLVEQAVAHLRNNLAGRMARILDIGTGSGCIAVALAKMVSLCSVLAVDISDDALSVATENARRNGVSERVALRKEDILRTANDGFGEKFDLVVSNPPYLSLEELKSVAPEIRDFEPTAATTDGGDGLRFYGHLARKAQSWLIDGGVLMVEIAYDQSSTVMRLFAEGRWEDCRIVNDYSGDPRCLLAWRSKNVS